MKKLVFLVFIFVASVANAQFTETLSSDRPGQALSVNTVGKNVFQIQAGFDFPLNNISFTPSSYFRYGLSERLELNSGILFSDSDDVRSLTIGARYSLTKNNSSTSSSIQASYDIGGDEKNTQVVYIFSSNFNDKLSYTANLGFNVNEDFGDLSGLYVFNLSYAINTKVGVFAETFGTFLNSGFELNLDTGVYYLLNNNLQLDALLGYNNDLFASIGVTWRLPSKK